MTLLSGANRCGGAGVLGVVNAGHVVAPKGGGANVNRVRPALLKSISQEILTFPYERVPSTALMRSLRSCTSKVDQLRAHLSSDLLPFEYQRRLT